MAYAEPDDCLRPFYKDLACFDPPWLENLNKEESEERFSRSTLELGDNSDTRGTF